MVIDSVMATKDGLARGSGRQQRVIEKWQTTRNGAGEHEDQVRRNIYDNSTDDRQNRANTAGNMTTVPLEARCDGRMGDGLEIRSGAGASSRTKLSCPAACPCP